MIADPLLRPLLLTLQGLGFFIGLSVDGAMGRGAQDQGEKAGLSPCFGRGALLVLTEGARYSHAHLGMQMPL